MKPRTRLHCAARKARSTLQVGRTPACWTRLVEARTRRVERASRLCTWVESTPRPPRLQPQPLFGSCLKDLTQPEHTADEPGEIRNTRPPGEAGMLPKARIRTRGVRHHPAERLNAGRIPMGARPAAPRSPEAERDPALEVPRPLPAHRRLAAASLERRAGTDLLKRLAGALQGAGKATARPRRDLLGQAAGGGSSGQRRSLPLKSDEWPAVLGKRLQSALARSATRLSRSGPQSKKTLAGFTVEQALLPSWEAVLNGPPAPPELLARLAGMSQAEALASPDSHRSGGAPRRRSARGSQRAMLPDEKPAPEQPDAGFQPEPGMVDAPAAAQIRRSEFTPLAPPGATGSLPPLAAPQKPYDPTLPVAAATLRYGAQREAAETAPEDLSDLATKIKRILDEEARRQGIHVP